jgi:hypothetical protein
MLRRLGGRWSEKCEGQTDGERDGSQRNDFPVAGTKPSNVSQNCYDSQPVRNLLDVASECGLG